MRDKPTGLLQQYGTRPERVTPELNIPNAAIYLNNLPPDSIALLLRDIGDGDRLVTERVARDYLEGLKRVTRRAEQEFQEMLRKAPSRGSGSDDFIYVGGTVFPFD